MLHATTSAHEALGVWLVAACAAVGLWGSISFLVRQHVSARYRTAFLGLVALAALQCVVGVLSVAAGGDGRAGWTHVIASGIGIVLLGVPYLWAARGSPAREAVTLAVVAWLAAAVFGDDLSR